MTTIRIQNNQWSLEHCSVLCIVWVCVCACVRVCVCACARVRGVARARACACVCVCVVELNMGVGEGTSTCCVALNPLSRTAFAHSLPTDRKTSRTALLFLRSFLSPLFLLCSCLRFSSRVYCVCVCVCDMEGHLAVVPVTVTTPGGKQLRPRDPLPVNGLCARDVACKGVRAFAQQMSPFADHLKCNTVHGAVDPLELCNPVQQALHPNQVH